MCNAGVNEWKHRYPEKDPVGLHQRYWQRPLVGPDGEWYRWNERWHTMESTVIPASLNGGPGPPEPLQNFTFGNFGLTFEAQGLRAKVELEMTAKEGN